MLVIPPLLVKGLTLLETLVGVVGVLMECHFSIIMLLSVMEPSSLRPTPWLEILVRLFFCPCVVGIK